MLHAKTSRRAAVNRCFPTSSRSAWLVCSQVVQPATCDAMGIPTPIQ